MFARVWKWISERWPITAVVRATLEEDIPGGAKFAYTFGSTALVLFALQAVTGIFQLFYYVPSVDHAYGSVSYLRTQVPFGWLLHGLHFWGATAMVALVLLHLCRVYIWGAFKKPREMTWLFGVILFLSTLGMMFTGAPLPWDERGYWATEVGTSIAGTVPLIGDFAKRILLGAESMGQLTLSRFFIVHVAILPGLMMTFIVLHLVAFRRFGSVGPWAKKKRERSGPFWPDQVFKDTTAAALVLVILIALAVWAWAPFAGAADPVDTTYQPKPEWTFLFIYQALKFFSGRLEPVGTVGLPLFGILLFILVPFLGKKEERNPAQRPLGMTVFAIVVVSVILLSIAGAVSQPGSDRQGGSGPQVATAAKPLAPGQKALKLFQSAGCIGCHMINGAGGQTGPDLSNEAQQGRSEQWLIDQIKDPKSHFPNTIMPSFAGRLSAEQIVRLVDYLRNPETSDSSTTSHASSIDEAAQAQEKPGASGSSPSLAPAERQPGMAAGIIGNAELGSRLFQQFCESCHGAAGTDQVPNPGSDDGTIPPLNPIDRDIFDRAPQVFADNIDRFIQHGSVPAGPNPSLRMHPFGDSMALTQQQISNVEAYVLALNGVDRAKVIHPGLSPGLFLLLIAVVFGLAFLTLGLLRIWTITSFRASGRRS